MSVQIRIHSAAMTSAGWVCVLVETPEHTYPCDHTGDPVYVPGTIYPVWKKDGVKLEALMASGNDFRADCRSGGHNHQLFEKLGLLNLPHSFE